MQNQQKAMQDQLQAAREMNRNQNLITITEYLQVESRRKDRRVLIELGRKKKPFATWSKEERYSAERACAAYSFVGLLVRKGMVPEDIALAELRDSAQKCFNAAAPLLTEYRKTRGEDFWANFDWFTHQANFNKIDNCKM